MEIAFSYVKKRREFGRHVQFCDSDGEVRSGCAGFAGQALTPSLTLSLTLWFA
jgi:hypothetical protein